MTLLPSLGIVALGHYNKSPNPIVLGLIRKSHTDTCPQMVGAGTVTVETLPGALPFPLWSPHSCDGWGIGGGWHGHTCSVRVRTQASSPSNTPPHNFPHCQRGSAVTAERLVLSGGRWAGGGGGAGEPLVKRTLSTAPEQSVSCEPAVGGMGGGRPGYAVLPSASPTASSAPSPTPYLCCGPSALTARRYTPAPPPPPLTRKKKRATPTEMNVHRDALCFMVKAWARHY